MTMDFFGKQHSAQVRSVGVLICFALAMFVIAVCVNVVASSVSYLLGFADSFWHMSSYAVLLTAILWVAITAGCLFRWSDVRSGGDRLAKRFGAEAVFVTSGKQEEKVLLDVVAEMSVASGHVAPSVWVIRAEKSINAFVVGGDVKGKSDIALVVTQGLLTQLNRDETQAVIAHEFGHLCSGDLIINMRLLIAMGGLMAIDEVGLTLGADGAEKQPPWAIVGWVLRFIGVLGTFLANIIRSAFSRNREYLADACAVQFTRNPYALASALSKVDDSERHGFLNSRYANELAHLCFQVRARRRLFQRWLATHPPLTSRVAAIDPHFKVKLRARTRAQISHETESPSVNRQSGVQAPAVSRATSLGAFVGLASVTGALHQLKRSQGPGPGGALQWQASTTKSRHLSAAHSTTIKSNGVSGSVASKLASTGLSDSFEVLLSDGASCLAAVFVLFASEDDALRQAYIGSIAFAYKKEFAQRVEKLYYSMGAQLQLDRMLVIEYLAPQLREKIQPTNRRRLMQNLEKLLEMEGESTLPNFAAVQLLRHRLEVDFPLLAVVVESPDRHDQRRIRAATGDRVQTLESIDQHVSLLLSLLIEASGNSSERLDAEYQRVLRCYTSKSLPRRSSDEAGIVAEMQVAFHALSAQPQVVRDSFIDHCREIACLDFFTAPDESVLIDLFSASLNFDRPPQYAVA